MIRTLYRASLPRHLRLAIRRGLGSLAPALAARPARLDPESPRRFELALPMGPTDAARRTLAIDAPNRLMVPRLLEAHGVGGFEPETIAAILGLVETVRPAVVYDVGANVGPHALLVPALLDVPVVAFEASADTAAALRHLVALNNLPVTVVEAAAGELAGVARFYISPTDTSSSLNADWRNATGIVEVPVLTLDGYAAAHPPVPGVIKIDTETTEPDVLRGAPALLATRPWIVCEVLPGHREGELDDILLPLGYIPFHIDGSSPMTRHARVAGAADMANMNWLFAPSEPPDALWAAVDRWRAALDATPAP